MTTIAGTPPSLNFDKSMFSDPSMRSYLKEYYEDSYAAVRERVAKMKEAESNGQAPNTIKTRDGKIGTELSATQYESMIPSFDKWLEMQQNFSVFDAAEQNSSLDGNVQETMAQFEEALNPDLPSDVRTVFSNGDQILGYINKTGSVVTHEGGSALQKIAEQANKLNLVGEARIAYIEKMGQAELSKRYPDLQVEEYNSTNAPTRREFSEKWYPDHDVDKAYESALQEFKASLDEQQSWQEQQKNTLDQMHSALLKIMEEAQDLEQAA